MNETSGAFSASALGGWHASFIESQDSVAACLALEAIAGYVGHGLADISGQRARISCEWQDDVGLHWDSGRILAQVKQGEIGLADIRTIASNFQQALEENSDPPIKEVRIYALGGLGRTARHLPDHISQLKTALEHMPEHSHSAIRDFETKWDLPIDVVMKLRIDTRDLRRDSPTCRAIFSALLRAAAPVYDYTDHRVEQLYDRLAGGFFALARRQRHVVPLTKVQDDILADFLPLGLFTWDVNWTLTSFGYLKDPQKEADFQQQARLVRAAFKRIMKKWRRHYFHDFLSNLAVGPIRCPNCNHSLNANWGGLRGIACPDCGYNPYLTLGYVCDCVDIIPLCRQPSTERTELVSTAVAATRTDSIRCPTCNAKPSAEKLFIRLVILPIPIPIEEHSAQKLIELRERLGWDGARWTGGEESPRERMLKN
ncbi:hypothetical protein ACWEJ6_52850 [Nonomuraea sp. NPDC004702]